MACFGFFYSSACWRRQCLGTCSYCCGMPRKEVASGVGIKIIALLFNCIVGCSCMCAKSLFFFRMLASVYAKMFVNFLYSQQSCRVCNLSQSYWEVIGSKLIDKYLSFRSAMHMIRRALLARLAKIRFSGFGIPASRVEEYSSSQLSSETRALHMRAQHLAHVNICVDVRKSSSLTSSCERIKNWIRRCNLSDAI